MSAIAKLTPAPSKKQKKQKRAATGFDLMTAEDLFGAII
jgi:hypothetical protein